MSLIDDFNILELPTNATEQEAKAAYRRLARRYHPDKNPDQDTTEHFQRIHDAYQNVLSAIKRSQGQNWQPYSFTNQASKPDSAGHGHRGSDSYQFESDVKQREYVKEQQRAYQEMKRSNAQQERAREEALRNARDTLHQRRMNALYEEMRKADNQQQSSGAGFSFTDNNGQDDQTNHDFQPFNQSEATQNSAQHKAQQQNHFAIKPFRLHAAKAAFIACTYLGVFAAGVYSSLYWQQITQNETSKESSSPYISGLYPQHRSGTNYTLKDTRLFSEPSVAASINTTIPALTNVKVLKLEGDWMTLSYSNYTGWSKAENFGFGSIQAAESTGCIGQPGLAPRHGAVIGKAEGNSRLRILNKLTQASLLTFQSLDGQTPFSIYLQAGQPFAANFIPKGDYRMVLETGSLYHHACQHFLFDDQRRIVLDKVSFASTEQTLTLQNLSNP